jgi:hypothetical protein
MYKLLSTTNKVTFLLLWIGVTLLAWLVSPVNTLYPTLRTYLEVAARVRDYAVCGLIIGSVTSIGQTLILRLEGQDFKRWLGATLIGYALAWPAGLFVATLIPTVTFGLKGSGFLPLTEPTTIFYFPYPTDIILGGGVVGFAQWLALRHLLPHRNTSLAGLWIMGVWLSIGLGIVIGLLGRTIPLNHNSGMLFDSALAIERVKTGVASGFITALLLLFITYQASQQEKPTVLHDKGAGV